MAQAPNPVVNADQAQPSAAPKRRASTNPRAPQGPRTVYVILQVLGDNGEPIAYDKKRVRLVGLETSAETMLGMVDAGEQENVFFLRGQLKRRSRVNAPATPAVTGLQGPRAA